MKVLHRGSIGLCCTYGAKHTQFNIFLKQKVSEHLNDPHMAGVPGVCGLY